MNPGSAISKLTPELGVLGAFVVVALAIANVVQWRKAERRDSTIASQTTQIQKLNDRIHDLQKEHTDQLMASSDTLRQAMEWIERMGRSRD